MREASNSEPQVMQPNDSLINGNNMMRQSNLTDAAPITRSSLAALAGDENDLLAESPVFESAKGVGMKERSPADMYQRSSVPEVPEEPLDDQLINEINDYLQGIMEDGTRQIEMSDSPIKSQGAECVSAAISFCENVFEVRLANCEIRDAGAIKLFAEFQKAKNVEVIDLSGNPITERSFDAIETCLSANGRIKQVVLANIQVKSNFAWGKFKKFGSIV